MVGKCIRKLDRSTFKFKLSKEKLTQNFCVHDGAWKLIGNQKAFESEFEFQNEIIIAIIFHDLHYGVATIGGENYLKLLNMVYSNKNKQEETIIKWLCDNEWKEIVAFSKKDIIKDDNTGIPCKSFIRGNEYRGVYFENSHYLLIGETVGSYDEETCIVNGKIVDVYPEDGEESEVFDSFFLLFDPKDLKGKKKIWNQYEKKCIEDKFDL